MQNFYLTNDIFLKKMLKFSLVFLALTIAFFEAFTRYFAIWIDRNKERCIPQYSVYLLFKNAENIGKGDIVAFKTHQAIRFYPLNSYFGKYVAAKAGDKVEINAHGVLVNNQQVATGFSLSEKLDLKVHQLYRKFSLKANQFFVLGKSDNSYDSRYWGVINQKQIIGKAIPLW